MVGLLLISLFQHHLELLVSIVCISAVVFVQYLRTKRDPSISWPIVGMLPNVLLNFKRLHDYSTEFLQLQACTAFFKGPWFIGMDFLFTCDPANIQHILNTNFANYPKGEEFIEMFDILGNGIFNSDGDTWKSHRRITHALMAEKKFRHFITDTTRHKMKTAMIPMLDEVAMVKNSVLDLQDLFLRLTFDLTSTLVMGVDPCCLSPGLPTVPFARAIDDCMEAILVRHIVPPFWWKLMRRLGIWSENKIASAWETIESFVSTNVSMMKKKKDSSDDDIVGNISEGHSPDMITSWLSSNMSSEDKYRDGTTAAFLRDMVINMMLAGRDTIASGLSWFFYLIAQNPEVESKIVEELKANPKVCGDEIEENDLKSLTYIHACLCESLRLYPPVPFEHKTAVHEDTLPSSHVVKPGSRIVMSFYSTARIEGVWGKDCKEYRPERWMEPSTGKIRYEPSYKFAAFNSGQRTCLGKDIAFTQMKLVVVAVLSRFHVQLVQGHVVVPKPSILLHMTNGLMVKIYNRPI